MVNHPNRAKGKKPRVAVSASPAPRPKRKPAARPRLNHDADYGHLLGQVSASFKLSVATGGRFFCTDASGLADLYIRNLPSERQIHTCSACRKFLETYGGLVMIDEDGRTHAVMWTSPDLAPDFYGASYAALKDRVESAKVTGPFLTSEKVWGQPSSDGGWTHFAVQPPPSMVFRDRLLTPGQKMAAHRHNFETVENALREWPAAVVSQLLDILKGEHLSRSEKFVGPVEWLNDLHARPKGKRGANVLWRAIASAPEGYCHPKASVMGPLLDGLASGTPFASIKRDFEKMIEPLRYQRPQAAPTAGNIRAAEAAFEKLGLAPALERRFARLEECVTVWKPFKPYKPTSAGVFGHLKPKGSAPPSSVKTGSTTMTWEKFSRVVLPTAERIEIMVPAHGAFVGVTTAVHDDAPPIFKWDSPVAWYVYSSGSSAGMWNLNAHRWTPLTAVMPFPTVWGLRQMPELADGVILVIEGAREAGHSSLALFPECLRSDLHAYRSTIEAYSRNGRLQDAALGSANGYDIRKGAKNINVALRVLTGGVQSDYVIDRWD